MLVLATEYAAGHSFWSGGPVDWWIRGTLAFLFLNSVPIVGATLIYWVLRRSGSWIAWLGMWACVGLCWCILLPSMGYRDRDRPSAIGWIWGDRARPWITLLCLGASAIPLIRKRIIPQGFSVVQSVKDVPGTEQ